jgi:hypothetical protein
MDTLMTSDADREAFRRVYPFSPALIETLVAVSSYLQRERTALRLLMQLLVEKRDELTVGDLVPIGDLYDVIRSARSRSPTSSSGTSSGPSDLYEQAAPDAARRARRSGRGDVAVCRSTHPFRTDDRLVKTLLLAALVPASIRFAG